MLRLRRVIRLRGPRIPPIREKREWMGQLERCVTHAFAKGAKGWGNRGDNKDGASKFWMLQIC